MIPKMLGVIDATVFYKDLHKLFIHRLPSAIQFGGRYRLIDFSLSNFKNSGIRNVAIYPNGNYRSLTDHVSSGKVWDLDRKRDGLFILPPKRIIDQSEEMISFARMKEHMEYFLRSKQDYVVLTSGVLVWNINFTIPLKNHIDTQADITEIKVKNQRVNTFILKKAYLIQLILQHEYLGFKNLIEVIQFAHNIKVNDYEHQGYTKMIKSIQDLYESHMDMLNFDIGKSIFKEEEPMLSKTKDSPPTFYKDKAKVKNTIVANGANINGYIENSIISRDVFIEEGVSINHSIIMQQSKILANAILDYCIIDKNTIIGENVVLKGSKENPVIVEKEEKIITKSKMKIFHVATECAPFIKTGGLADVLAALPKSQRDLGIEISVCIPLYQQIKNNYQKQLHLEYTILIDDQNCLVYSLNREGVRYYFIKIEDYFEQKKIYGNDNDLVRYYYLNKCVLQLIEKFEYPPDIIHIHDYHVCLIPILIRHIYKQYNRPKTCLTIHNIKYQGIYYNEKFINKYLKDITSDDSINFLKLGLSYTDIITTVSPTYSKELQYEFFSENLQDIIIKRKNDLYGILNGLDDNVFHPKTDISIALNYDINSIDKKKENKRYLQQHSNLTVDEHIPIIGMVTRLVEQKGIDLVLSIFDKLMETEKVQFVLLGTGNTVYETEFKYFEKKYPKRVKANIGYDAFNPNQIYAGADLFLMPSKFEPCGISQMIALKYGTIPIVRETGGLKDTVFAYNEFTKNGNGFTFTNYNAQDMLHTIKRAITFYNQKNDWNEIVKSAMNYDFNYHKTAMKYYRLYEILLK
ncbi:glycogen/starch synthase [Mycoplasmatota bacterium]|nr:glycogen/starch synthase [Mycoplasmatota bacterium]